MLMIQPCSMTKDHAAIECWFGFAVSKSAVQKIAISNVQFETFGKIKIVV